MLDFCQRARTSRLSSRKELTKAPVENRQAPHPITQDQEGKVCPITGLFATSDRAEPAMTTTAAALAAFEADPDIAEERRAGARGRPELAELNVFQGPPEAMKLVPLNVSDGAHRPNQQTRRLLRAIGGLQTLRRFTVLFYQKCEVDPHLDQFIRRHTDPHAERFALWIMEKFGEGTPWTHELRVRKTDRMRIGGQVYEVSYDRSSAHFAAWHSPKRPEDKQGERFKPHDARVWMRLHFWAAREVGLFEPQHSAFMDYYTRFIGNFISVYSSKSPPFTRESARWSADPRNIECYRASGNRMADVLEKPVEEALLGIPVEERVYTGSRHHAPAWPYELTSVR